MPSSHLPQSQNFPKPRILDIGDIKHFGKFTFQSVEFINFGFSFLQAIFTASQKGQEKLIIGIGFQMWLLGNPLFELSQVVGNARGNLTQKFYCRLL